MSRKQAVVSDKVPDMAAFLSELQGFDKAKLKETETVVTHAPALGVDDDEAKSSGGSDPVGGGAAEGGAGGDSRDAALPEALDKGAVLKALMWRSMWVSTGDTLRYGPRDAKVRVGVFMTHGLQQESDKFDTFAWVLAGETHANVYLEQFTADDVIRGELDRRGYTAVVFPGGSIFEVEAVLGDEGAAGLAQFIRNGGGYFGACAGGFLASRRGYSDCRDEYALLGTETGWVKGVGRADVRVLPGCSEVFGDAAGKQLSLYFANGACFAPAEGCRHCDGTLLEACTPLVEYKSVQTRSFNVKFGDKEGEGSLKSLETGESGRGGSVPPRYAAVGGTFGKGRIVAFGPHPEASGSVAAELVRRAVEWVSRRPDESVA